MKYESRKLTEIGANALDNVYRAGHHNALLITGTGGGKTFMSIHALGKLADSINVLVFSIRSVIDNKQWEESFDAYNQATNHHLEYAIFNYEKLDSKSYRNNILNSIRFSSKPVAIILDEAHKIANPTAKRSKFIFQLNLDPKVKTMMCLTATSINNSLLDACSYLILDYQYKNKTDFYNQHVKSYDKFYQPIVKDRKGNRTLAVYNNPGKILTLLKNITVNVDTESVIPPLKSYDLVFEMPKHIKREYNQIQRDYKKGLIENSQQRISMQHDFLATHATQRLNALAQLIDSPDRVQTPILIFYQYVSEYQKLYNYLKVHYGKKYHIKAINGSSKKIDIRKAPPKNTLFLIQYQAGATGLNAQWSSISVFFTPPMSNINYEQAKGRNRRAYQKGTVYQFRFIVKNTINAFTWWDIVDNKLEFSNMIYNKYLDRKTEQNYQQQIPTNQFIPTNSNYVEIAKAQSKNSTAKRNKQIQQSLFLHD